MLAGISGGRLLDAMLEVRIEPREERLLARQHDLGLARLGVLLGGVGELVARPHAVADVGRTGGEDAVLVDERLVDGAALHDLARDVVPDREVGVGLEDDLDVGRLRRAVVEGGQVEDAVALPAQALVDDARPEHRVHLGHVGAPEHHAVGGFDVVVAAGRLVDAEGLHEAGDRRGHAVAGVGVEVVRAPAGLDQLRRGVALLDRVLTGTHDADAGRPECFVGAPPLALHLVEGALPGDRGELAALVELAVLHAQQRMLEPVGAVGDLGVGVALDAEQPAVDRARGVAAHRDNALVVGGDLDAAADAAEAADAFVPLPGGHRVERAGGIREAEAGQSDGRRGGRCDAGAQELAAGERVFHGLGSRKTIPVSAAEAGGIGGIGGARSLAVDEVVDELDAADMGETADRVEESFALGAVGALENGDAAPGSQGRDDGPRFPAWSRGSAAPR